MRLRVHRALEEKKGLFSGSQGYHFRIAFGAELTAEERDLIKKYSLRDFVLLEYKIGEVNRSLRVRDLEEGHGVFGSVTELLSLEGEIKDACRSLKAMLEIMATWDSEEFTEI